MQLISFLLLVCVLFGGGFFYGHEFGYASGQDYQKSISEVIICKPGYDFYRTAKAFGDR